MAYSFPRGLPGYRFVPSPEVFMSAKTYAENECFCVDKDICDMIGDGMVKHNVFLSH